MWESTDNQNQTPDTDSPIEFASSPAPSAKQKSKILLAELRQHLGAVDSYGCLTVCESLAALFCEVQEADKAAVLNDLLQVIFLLKQHFANFAFQQRSVLVEALFKINKVIVQSSGIKTPDRFLANYTFYWCAKRFPQILNEPEAAAEVRAAVERALICVDRLTPVLNREGSFRSARLSSHSFWHRVAQLYLARWTLGLAKPEELPAMLEVAIDALKRIVNLGVGMSSLAVRHNRARLAGCLDWLGRLYAEKREWQRSNIYYIESDRLFAEIAELEPGAPIICRNAFLAEFYFSLQEFSLAFEEAQLAVQHDQASVSEGAWRGSFHHFLDRLIRFGGPDPVEFLFDLLNSGLPPVSNLIALSALSASASMRADWIAVQTAQWLFLKGAEQVAFPEITSIPEDKRHLLITSAPHIKEFVRDCERRINEGDAASQIDLLTKLVAGSKAMSFDQREDVVLLSLLAQAFARIGDYDSASGLLNRLLEVDPTAANRSITLYLLGDVHLAKGDLGKAAHAYEISFRIGRHLSALFKAALARTYAGDFDIAIRHLSSMLSSENSNLDAAPHQTRTVLARAYWGRYCLDEESGGKKEADVEAACHVLREVLDGTIDTRHVHDAEAISRFVDMTTHPVAAASIADLLKTTWNSQQVSLFSDALGRRHVYPGIIIEVALERLSEEKLWEEVKRGFVRILAKALARAYHYGEIEGLTFESLAALIVRCFKQFPSGAHQEWLSELLLIEQHASKAELIERYADEAIKVFAPIMGAPEEAIKALGDPEVLKPINDFLLRRMPPDTEPRAYGHTDSADLYVLAKELIDDLSVEFAEPLDLGSSLSLARKSGSATVSLMNWLDLIRPFILSVLDIPRHRNDNSARGPLALLAAEAPPWSIHFEVSGSRIEIRARFYRIEGPNPTLVLEQTGQWLETECSKRGIKELVQLDLHALESEHTIGITVRVPQPKLISPEFERMTPFVEHLKKESYRMVEGGAPTRGSYHKASILFASAFHHVRNIETKEWVEFIRHLLDVRYVAAASWLLFLPLEGGDTGKHPRSIVHDLKKKVQLAMLKQESGNEVSREELAELRRSQFHLAANILFASKDNFYMPRIWLKGAIAQVVDEFARKLPDLQFSVFCPPDVYARIHRELFSRALFNLLHNATTATMGTEARTVELRVTKDEDSWVRISIFNKYDPQRPRSETGTGIGLEEVKYFIANLSKGDVTVDRDDVHGEFKVSILLPDLRAGLSEAN